jgi:hypothetical protein
MARAHTQSLWVDRPWVDLLIGCGGWSAPLLLLSYLLLDRDALRWASVFYALALVCNYPHYMATVHRAYARGDDRAQYRLFTHYLTAGLLIVAAATHVRLELLPWLFTVYVMWSPWHYTGQNFGLAMMFLRRAGANVSPVERRRLRVAFVASYVMLLAAFNQGASQDPLVLSLGLPRAVSLAIEIAAGATFLVGGVWALYPLAGRVERRSTLLPAVTLYVTQACWFVIPIALTWASAVPAPQTRYSTGILAVMHSAQYLWITQHYARKDAARRAAAANADAATANAGGTAAWSGWAYWATLIVGGIALFLPGPWLASYIGRFDFTSSMLIVTAIVNIHHFMLDGVVWKLRDPRVAQALVDNRTNAAESAPTLGQSAQRLGRSMALSLTRPVIVTVLLALAALDQWRYALAQRDTDRSALEAASALNPYDGAVHMKLAKATIQTGEFQAAYAHCLAVLDRSPNDVHILVNAGVLAYKLGDTAGAEKWWTRALSLDSSPREVQLYLAELIDNAGGRSAEALPHYQRYLELVAHPTDDVRPPDPRQVAMVVLKFADALSRTGKAEDAASQYALAIRIAQQNGLTDIETLAREHVRH